MGIFDWTLVESDPSDEMANYRTDEDNLITFLSGFNQLFLTYLLITISVSLALEGKKGATGTAVPEDYEFDLDTALAKSTGHSTMVACLAFLGVSATIYVVAARLLQSRRMVDVHIFTYSRG